MAYKIGAVLSGSGESPCCCTPDLCCLYPGQGLSDGEYPYTDLPETLIDPAGIYGPYTLVAPYLFGTTMVYYDAPDFAGEKQYIGIEVGQPDWSSGSITVTSGQCLLSDGSIVEDEFPSSLSVEFSGQTTTVNRISRCQWDGVDLCGNIWSVWYGDLGGIGGVDYTWSALAYDIDFGEGIECPGEAFPPSQKPGSQNTPTGTYNLGIAIITVS